MKAKILIVDDSPLVRKLAEVSLQEAGYEVYTASDGEEGLRTAEMVKPDLVLVDFIMPKMTGSQFCKIFRENENLKDIPIILITGKGETVGQAFVEKYSVLDYIIKPFKSEELIEKIEKFLTERIEKEEVSEEIPLEEPLVERPIFEEKEAPYEEITEEFSQFDISEFISKEEIIEQSAEQITEIPEEQPLTEEIVSEEFISAEEIIPERTVSEEIKEEVFTFEEKIEEPQIKEEILQKAPSIDLGNIEKLVEDKFLSFLKHLDYSIEGIVKKYGLIKDPFTILSGWLNCFKLQDIFYLISSNKLTGILYFYGKGATSEFLFVDGMIVYGLSNLQRQKIGDKTLKDLNDEEVKQFTVEAISLIKSYTQEFFSFEKKDFLDKNILDRIKYNPVELFALCNLS